MKRISIIVLALTLCLGLFTGCNNQPADNGGAQSGGSDTPETQQASFDKSQPITVISREASSGTRSAFDELMNIVVKEGDNTVDQLFAEAIIVSSTDEVASKVEVDPYAIGYTSLGSVNNQVSAVNVDGVKASVENVLAGTYKISRPFIVAARKGGASEVAQDFLKYITSQQGQDLVEENGYIALDGTPAAYQSAGLSGKLTLSGSTSVEKVMEKLREEYIQLNPNVSIEITYNGSGAGIKDATESKVDLAMSSRELKDSEKESLEPTVFALDGIAVIVNKDNPLKDLSSEQITKIFTGELRNWSEVE